MKKKIIILISILFLLPNTVKANERVEVKFKSCVDGDTANFIMNDKTIKVRFLAINTPEIKHGKNKAEYYGNEAADYTCSRLKKATTIELEFDDGSEKQDKYDRYLAWIFLDNNLLQKDLIKGGYAEVKYINGDYAYTNELQKLESKAKEQEIGIWKDDRFDLKDFILNLSIYYKILITLLVIIIISIYLYVDKKARKKALRKGKKEVKKIIDETVKY